MAFTTYTLVDPRTRIARYAGQTAGLLSRRLSKHISLARKHSGPLTPVHAWIRELLDEGLRPLICRSTLTETEAIERLGDEALNVRLDEPTGTTGRPALQLSATQEALLGQVPDHVAAEALGIHASTACDRRRALNRPSFWQATGLHQRRKADRMRVDQLVAEALAQLEVAA